MLLQIEQFLENLFLGSCLIGLLSLLPSAGLVLRDAQIVGGIESVENEFEKDITD